MEWWQLVLLYSGGVFWFLVGLSTLLIVLARRGIAQETQDALEEFDLEEYTWVYQPDGSKPPVRVPKDLTSRAIELMNAKSAKEFYEESPPVIFTVNTPTIRAAMEIAQEEPDIEIALATWMANFIKVRPPEQ